MAVERMDNDKVNEIFAEFLKETDRAAAILISAEIETQLTALLEQFFVPGTTSSMRLLEPEAPLGSLGAKIELAYRVGMISPELHRELHLIRKIRNKFAHKGAGQKLTDAPLSDWVRQLWLGENYAAAIGMLLSDDPRINLRNWFGLSGSLVLTTLLSVNAKRVNAAGRENVFTAQGQWRSGPSDGTDS